MKRSPEKLPGAHQQLLMSMPYWVPEQVRANPAEEVLRTHRI